MISALPEGLPADRFAPWGAEGAWISDGLPPDLERIWGQVLAQHAATGLLPLLCRPVPPTRSAELAEVEAVRLDEVLPVDFAAYRRKRLPFWSDPTPSEEPDGIEPWPHDPGPPFESWPGLASPTPLTAGGPTPAQAAARTAADLARTGWDGVRDSCLALVPARRSADLPAALEWSPEAPVPLVCALLRGWEERYGAQVVTACASGLHVSVARPPRDLRTAELLALEHVLTTADSIVDDPPTPFPDYARELLDRTDWWFWWD